MRTRFVACAALVSSIALAGVAAAAGPAPPLLQGEPGIAVAGGMHVVALAGTSTATTRLWLVRDRDGKTVRARVIRGKLGVPAVTFTGLAEGTSAQGRRLLLASSIYDDADHTTFVVVDTRTLLPLRTIRLRGAFAFDALSPSGRRLYLLEYPQGLNGGIHYVVRSLNMRTGRLEQGAIVDRTEPDERMNGIAVARAWGPSRTWAYTLYTGGESHAFVHALNTRTRTARCIDLPWAGNAQAILDNAQMAVKADSLTVREPGGGVLARIDTRTFAVET
ncbi:hypothetical protein [Gaiella sp.]|jgi:hypothetical protein|uniref:hypothetical protein n=1 Tax=Gaiella sp. TaxID=2663207 RepID=UPI002E2FDAF5|nr:hypothetical protein [Gaiella sp.]HEX5582241.1 hypothetical protein [Gaiella sp.]